jgi:hypothetical protein
MHAYIINFIFLVGLVHLYLSASSPDWIGTYNVDDSCYQAECCCLSQHATISKINDAQLLVSASVAGVPCREQLNGSTTISELLPIPTDKNGYQLTTNFLGTTNRFTLSADNQYIANVNLQYPKCSGMARKVKSNWIGTFKVGESCNEADCCCLSEQAKITKLSDTQLLVSARVAGVPCKSQLNGSTSIEVPIPIPQDKNGYQITTTFLGTLNRFTLTYDDQYIAHANLDYPGCSGMAQRIDNNKNTASLISSTSMFVLIITFLFHVVSV